MIKKRKNTKKGKKISMKIKILILKKEKQIDIKKIIKK
jgi:hypothetical protein